MWYGGGTGDGRARKELMVAYYLKLNIQRKPEALPFH